MIGDEWVGSDLFGGSPSIPDQGDVSLYSTSPFNPSDIIAYGELRTGVQFTIYKSNPPYSSTDVILELSIPPPIDHSAPLDGISSGAATVQGSLTENPAALNAAITGQATVTGSVGVMLGTAHGDSTVTGSIVDSMQFSGTIAGSATVTGIIPVFLSGGEADCDGSVTGDLSDHILRGSVAGDGSVTGSLTGDIFTMGASSSGSATDTANLAFTRFLTGESDGDSSLIATLFAPAFLNGSVAGDSAAIGDFFISNLDGSVNGDSSLTSDVDYLGGVLHAQANPVGDSSLTVNMRWRGLLHPDSCIAGATVAAEVRRLWSLAGIGAGDSTQTGSFDIYTIPGGPIVGDSTCSTTNPTIQGHMSGEVDGSTIFAVDARNMLDVYTLAPPESANGSSVVVGYLYDRPQDFVTDIPSGAAIVIGNLIITASAMVPTGVLGEADIVTADLGLNFTFPAETIVGFAAFDLALLFINDSGLSRGSARLVAEMGVNSHQFFGTSHGFATFLFPPEFTLPGDLSGKTVDTWSGVGTWHPGGGTFVSLAQEIDQPPPVRALDGTPIATPGVGENGSNRGNSEHINVGFWDGTYTWGPDEPGILLQDPETGSFRYLKIGALKRRAQLADPGELGGWYVDYGGYRSRSPWGTSSGSAQVSADLFVEAKNALYGRPVGTSSATAAFLLATARLLMTTGNVALAVALSRTWQGNAAKSSSPTLPIDDPTRGIDRVAFVPPVQKRRTMYV